MRKLRCRKCVKGVLCKCCAKAAQGPRIEAAFARARAERGSPWRFRMERAMSDGDFRGEMARVLETSGKAALERWKVCSRAIRRNVRHECTFCRQVSDVEVEGLPEEEVRHVVKFLTEATMAKPKEDAGRSGRWMERAGVTDLELGYCSLAT